MGTIAQKGDYLENTKLLLKQKINNLGGDIPDQTTFRQYADKLQEIYDNAPKTDYAEGSNITLENCLKGKLDFENDKVGYGDTEQAILPSVYQQVEYIESTGSAYLDTGIVPNTNTKIDIQFETIQKGTNGVIFGGETTYNSSCFHLYNTSGNFDIGFGSKNTGFAISVPYDLNTKYKFIMDKNGFDVNGTTGTFPESTISTTISIFLFAVHRGNSSNVIDSNAQKRIYYCKLYDNGTLVRNMIPCYRISDNVIGMYDIVNNTFYTNAGTGTFTKGNNAPTPTTPIPIQVVTGEQEVTIRGKNLFSDTLREGVTNYQTAQYIYPSPARVTTTNWIILSKGTYTISAKNNKNKNLKVSNITFTTNGNYYEISGVTGQWLNLPLTITFPQDTKWQVNISYTDDTNILPNEISDVQLETGSTATDYEPYITPITKTLSLGDKELYEDSYISYENGDFYFNDNYKKTYPTAGTFDTTTSSFNNMIIFAKPSDDIKYDTYQTNTNNKCNKAPFLQTSYSAVQSYRVAGNVYGNMYVLVVPKTTTSEDVANIFNGLYIIYQVTTPIKTKVTNTTQISQLEDIWNSQSINGTTIIEIAGTLPMIIKARALKGE